jgi:hypothetical protein
LLKISVLSRRLVCLMAADDAPCRGAEDAVMTGKVPGRAADQGTFNATFGVGRGRHAHSRKRNRGKSKGSFHRVLLVVESTMLGGDLRSDEFSRCAGFAGWQRGKIKPLSKMGRRTSVTGIGPLAGENGWLTLRYMGGQMTGDKVRRPIDSRSQ